MLLFCAVTFRSRPAVDMSVHDDHGAGAAKRRRDRRLRMHWRHEQLTLRMALAAALHHSRGVGPVTCNALRSQRTARAEATNNTLWSQMTSVGSSSRCAREELGGTRPDRLIEVRPQERDQWCTVVQIVDSPQVVPSLDVPAPQMENQLVEVCRQLDMLIPEQAIEVRKTSSSSRHSRRRRVRFAQQTGEQLVEVPTIVSYSSLDGLVEQNVDIPVPHGRGGRVGVRGLTGFNSVVGADRVDIPVPRSGGLQGSRPRQSSSASSAHLPGVADEFFYRVFSHFSPNFFFFKKVRGWARTRGRN